MHAEASDPQDTHDPSCCSWNERPAETRIESFLASAASRWPDKVAIDFYDYTLTFRELHDLAARAAKGLQSLGVGPDVHVALHLLNTPHYAVFFFAVLMAGGRVANFSPHTAARELERQIVESDARVVVTMAVPALYQQVAALKSVTGLKTIIVCWLDDFLPASRRQAFVDLRPETLPGVEREIAFAEVVANDGRYRRYPHGPLTEEVAVLQYTGGTTGDPKGVMLTHANFAAVPSVIGLWVGDLINSDGSMLVVLPLSHIFGLAIMLLAVALGVKVVLCLRFEPDQVLADFDRKNITVFFGVPSMYTALVHHRKTRNCDLSSLKICGSGGAPLPLDVLARFREMTGIPILEGYSLTEITDLGTWQAMGIEPRAGTVGLPLPQTTVEVVDMDTGMQVLPNGELGEVCFSGPQVMKGYWKRPAATSEVLRGGRFHTGDIGIVDHDGYVTLVGRKNEMIVCGGHNVFPSRIEAAICEHPSVAEAAVIGVPNPYLGQVAKACIVLKSGQDQFTSDQLRAFLSDKLASHESPVEIKVYPNLPKTSVGKISKKELAKEAPASHVAPPARTKPSDVAVDPLVLKEKTLHHLRALFAGVAESTISKIRAEDIDRDADLSMYGFDSISFTLLANQINQIYRLELPPTIFFEHSTLESLANYLIAEHAASLAARHPSTTPVEGIRQREVVEAGPRSCAVPFAERTSDALAIEPTAGAPELTGRGNQERAIAALAVLSRGGTAPLSHGQERLWLLEQSEELGAAYHIPLVLRLSGCLDTAALDRALTAHVQRHEILRTNIVLIDGIPTQILNKSDQFRLVVESLERLPESEREDAAHRRKRAIVRRPFDLFRDPLFRAVLLRLSATDHILILVLHHIVTDGWSVDILFREVETLYGHCVEGHGSPLPELPIQYADYAFWQRDRLTSGTLNRQLEYWRVKLQNAPTELTLPTDRARPRRRSFRGAELPIALSPLLTAALGRIARGAGATLFMVLLAAFQLLLSRLSGQDDIVVGTPAAGRTRHEFQGLVGFFINTLALRTDLSGNPTFRELLGRVKQTALGAFEHQEIPFERIVEMLSPIRDSSRPILFHVLFQLARRNTTADVMRLPGLSAQPLSAEAGTAQFDISVSLFEGSAGVSGYVEYAVDLFDELTIKRLVEQFLTLLEGIANDPDSPISRLPLLTGAERRLLIEMNDTAENYPRDACLHELFADQAAKTPDAPAVVFEDRTLSYLELNHRSNQLAHHLRKLGVGPEVVVGLCVERSLEMVIGLLAVLKAGGAYLPLDPSYPTERLRYMLSDARAKVLMTQSGVASELGPNGVKVVRVDSDWPQIAQLPTTSCVSGVGPDNLAYVMYTSGSTGTPKGIAMPHGPLVNLITWHLATLGDPTASRTLQFAPISFDVSVQEIFTALIRGRALFLISQEIRLDMKRLLAFVRERDIHEIFVPQVVLEQLADEARDQDVYDIPLRHVYQAGEKLHLSPAIREFFEKRPRAFLHNHYGPTETHVATGFCLSDIAEQPYSASIGRPISNTQCYVLNDRLEAVPVGVVGEICIGGACLARGYLHRADWTAERFVPNPFGQGERLYRTGDLGRYLADGSLELIGRIDDQVKLRGYRIELGEIEAALTRYPGIAQAVVVLREDAGSERRLVGYLVTTGPKAPELRGLWAHLRQSIPEYMVPPTLVIVEALPRTPSGKIDRRALPAPAARPENGTHVAPRTDLERKLAAIWCETLKRDRISVDDNFFELGGHSLIAARLCHRIGVALGRSLRVAMLFERPTVAQLAERLQPSGARPDSSFRVTLRSSPAARHAICFLPTIIGFGTHYNHIARRIKTAGAIYTCRLKGTDSGEAPLTRMEDISEHCRTQLISSGEHVEWSLVGWSFGGLLAYETARQISTAGMKVRRVVLIDTFFPGQIDVGEARALSEFAGHLLGQEGTLRASYPGSTLPDDEKTALTSLAEAYRDRFGIPRDDQIYLTEMLQTYRANLAAIQAYRCGEYLGEVVQIRAEESLRALSQVPVASHWSVAFAQQTVVVPGDHYSIMAEEHAFDLAKLLDEIIG